MIHCCSYCLADPTKKHCICQKIPPSPTNTNNEATEGLPLTVDEYIVRLVERFGSATQRVLAAATKRRNHSHHHS